MENKKNWNEISLGPITVENDWEETRIVTWADTNANLELRRKNIKDNECFIRQKHNQDLKFINI